MIRPIILGNIYIYNVFTHWFISPAAAFTLPSTSACGSRELLAYLPCLTGSKGDLDLERFENLGESLRDSDERDLRPFRRPDFDREDRTLSLSLRPPLES